MKLVEAMYGWNRNSDEIGVGPWPDTTGWSDRYSLTGGACYTNIRQMSQDQLAVQIFIAVSQMLGHSRGETWRRLILPEHNEEDADMKVVLLMMMVLTGFLAGCTTPAELAAQDHETCTGYGFNPQTMPADYAACRMHVAQDRENRDNMTRAALFVGSAARPAPRY